MLLACTSSRGTVKLQVDCSLCIGLALSTCIPLISTGIPLIGTTSTSILNIQCEYPPLLPLVFRNY